jgi:hypothetical protein
MVSLAAAPPTQPSRGIDARLYLKAQSVWGKAVTPCPFLAVDNLRWSQAMISPPFKIFVTAPIDYWLSVDQQSVKHKILDILRADEFEIELMGEFGMPYTQEKIWSHERTAQILQCCQGFVAIGFPRWHGAIPFPNGQPPQANDGTFNLATEYSHSEGALAFAHHLPMLLLIEDGVPARGILNASQTLVRITQGATDVDIATDPNFLKAYSTWRDKVQARYHLFFGYSGGASKTAALITKFLRDNGVRVRDWKNFQKAGTILEQIKRADETCLGGIFLLTGDDTQSSADGPSKVPRDNVIFEAGYFVNSKGDTRVLIILEKDIEILADMGGQIYLPLENRKSITAIKQDLLDFVTERVSKL